VISRAVSSGRNIRTFRVLSQGTPRWTEDLVPDNLRNLRGWNALA
jgi:hypothetical protein